MSCPRKQKIPKDIGHSSTCGFQSATANRGVHLCKNPLQKKPFLVRYFHMEQFCFNSSNKLGSPPKEEEQEETRTRSKTVRKGRPAPSWGTPNADPPPQWAPFPARCGFRCLLRATCVFLQGFGRVDFAVDFAGVILSFIRRAGGPQEIH